MSTFTLLIWEDFELQARLFLIPNAALSHDDRLVLRRAHGLLEGGGTDECPQSPEEQDALGRVLCAVHARESVVQEAYPELDAWRAKWLPHAQPNTDHDDAPIENTEITHVYRCGVSL